MVRTDWWNNSKIISVGGELLLRMKLKHCNTRKLTSFSSACSQPTATVTENTNNLRERHCLTSWRRQSASSSYEDKATVIFLRSWEPCGLYPADFTQWAEVICEMSRYGDWWERRPAACLRCIAQAWLFLFSSVLVMHSKWGQCLTWPWETQRFPLSKHLP